MHINSLSRRSLLKGFGGLTLAGGVSGCMSRSSSTTSSKEISFANWQDPFSDLYGKCLEDFESKGSLAVRRQADVSYDDYQTRFRTQLAGGSPPDVMRMNDDFLQGIWESGKLLDVSSQAKQLDSDSFYEDVFAYTERPDGRAGLAIGVVPRVVFYNKTLLSKRGITPPTTWTSQGWTWDDFLGAAKETRDDKTYGCVVLKGGGFENTFSVNNGTDGIYSADGRSFTLADPAGIEAVQWVVDLTLVHDVQPPWAELMPDYSDAKLFASGRVAMLFGPMALSTYFRETGTDFEWDIAPVPGRVRQQQEGSIGIFVIPKDSKNPEGAWSLLSTLVSKECGSVFAEAGAFIPVNKEAAKAVSGSATQGENVDLFTAAAEHNQAVNSTVATAEAQEIYRPQLERAYTGEVSVEEVLTGVRDQIESLLAGR